MPRRHAAIRTPVALAAACLVALAACDRGSARLPEIDFAGASMGTTWSVKLVAPAADVDKAALYADLQALLDGIEQAMSTWLPDSELSRFNATSSTDWVPVAAELCAAVDAALAISRETDGAFDVTVGPLVNLWGFGPDAAGAEPPDAERIAAAMQDVGYAMLGADCALPALKKDRPGLYVDLSAFAKGYAVDQAAGLLDARGFGNYMVEVGGEISVSGVNATRGPWRIAIEQPVTDERSVQAVMALTDTSIATSGDYRNYFEHAGRRYSHTIDPRTGQPVKHEAASVTIVADTAAYADAMATALLVLGPAEGMRLAEERRIDAYFLLHDDDTVVARSTPSFEDAGYLR